jgi:hypothetical protein
VGPTDIGYAAGVNLVETILVYAAIPGAIYGAVGLITNRSKFAGRPRYRPGQAWEYPPMWWSANPAGVGHTHADAPDAGIPVVAGASTVGGGARGNW